MDNLKIREFIILRISEALEGNIGVSGSFPDEECSPPFVVVSKQGVSPITTKANGLLDYNPYTELKTWLESGIYHARISIYTSNDEQGQDIAYRIKNDLDSNLPDYYKKGEPVYQESKDPTLPVSVYKGESKMWMTDMISSFYYETIYNEKKR